MAAVTQNGRALKYASARLRSDRAIVMQAIQRARKPVVKYASASLRGDQPFMREVVQHHWRAVQYAAASLKRSRTFMRKVATQRWQVLQYASTELKNDQHFMQTIDVPMQLLQELASSPLVQDLPWPIVRQRSPYKMVLAPPGAGKSTFLEYLRSNDQGAVDADDVLRTVYDRTPSATF